MGTKWHENDEMHIDRRPMTPEMDAQFRSIVAGFTLEAMVRAQIQQRAARDAANATNAGFRQRRRDARE